MLNGCLTGVDESPSRGIALSDAMKTSAAGGGPVSTSGSSSSGGSYSTVGVDAGAGASFGDGFVEHDDRSYAWQMSGDVGSAITLNSPIQSLTRITWTPFSVEDEENYGGLYIGGDGVTLWPGSLADQAVVHAWMFETGLTYRRYYGPSHAFINPYLAVNVSYNLLGWDYRNPIVVGSDVIRWDTLNGVGGYVGVGLTLYRSGPVTLFGEAGFGGIVFDHVTGQGFDNDVFSPFGYFSVRAGLSIKF